MFTVQNAKSIINVLKSKKYCYVSEAHLQLQFAIEGAKLFPDQFEFIPEYPGYTPYSYNNTQKTKFDLLVLDKKTNERTLIEFKYKTKNETKKGKAISFPGPLGTTLQLANDSAHNPNRYDCWKDIYRIERNVRNGFVKNGFFLFVTNEDVYINKDGSNSVFCKNNDFSMTPGKHLAQTKEVDKNAKESSAGAFRKNHPITIQKNYDFVYQDFQNFSSVSEYNKFWYLLVEIN